LCLIAPSENLLASVESVILHACIRFDGFRILPKKLMFCE
jgi:hypothetical protein